MLSEKTDYWLTPDELDEVISIIRSGEIVQGEEVEGFEREFASYIGSRYAVACNTGTSALHITLAAAGIKPKDEVITTPLSFVATSNSILYVGGRPIFADIDGKTLNISAESIKEKVTKETFAVLGVHLYGFPFDIEQITDSFERETILIEDAAQALGSVYKNKKVGTFGKAGIFSFYDTKHLKLGEGGMIVTDDEEMAEKCRMIRSHGAKKQYNHEMLGYNYRMNEIFGKIGRIQLKKIHAIVKGKRSRARLISEHLTGIEGISFPSELQDSKSSYYRFPVVLSDPSRREAILQSIKKYTSRTLTTGYPTLIYEQPLYQEITKRFPLSSILGLSDYKQNACPTAERIPSRIIEFPTDPWMPEDMLVEILSVFKREIKALKVHHQG